MVYRTRSPGSKRAPAADAGFPDPNQRCPLLPSPRRSARLLPTGHPAQGARARSPSTGDPCPEGRSPPRYARRRLTTTPLTRADLCLRSGSGARPDGTVGHCGGSPGRLPRQYPPQLPAPDLHHQPDHLARPSAGHPRAARRRAAGLDLCRLIQLLVSISLSAAQLALKADRTSLKSVFTSRLCRLAFRCESDVVVDLGHAQRSADG